MYCGKPGRGLLKAMVLACVIAGPVTNMGLNAKEVVRVFACSGQLSHNLSKTKHALVARPLRKALLGLTPEIADIKESFRDIKKVTNLIQHEIEDETELQRIRNENNYIDDMLGRTYRANEIEEKYHIDSSDGAEEMYHKNYLKKTEYRCEHQFSRSVYDCMKVFAPTYNKCLYITPEEWAICEPLRVPYMCNLTYFQTGSTCYSGEQVGAGLGEGYTYLKKVKKEVASNINDIGMQYKLNYEQSLYDIQDARETGEKVMHAFEEKNLIMQFALTVLNICLALLFCRVVVAARAYHDLYLTSIEFDNVYITSYFKKIDARRKRKDKNSLLPLKKMERNRYVDVHSVSYIPSERSKLLTQVLKVMLEVVTATTFVMLDRLFFEALDVVRQHALEPPQKDIGDLKVEVEGTGALADMMRKVIDALKPGGRLQRVSNEACLPKPRAMPILYYFKIYGGYLWILVLLYINPYTLRLRRLICGYFYPHREKQRILHLYNDILKKRMKMQKTLRRKAVRTVRAHYLSGENMLSLRIRYPQLLGWLAVLPMARMQCLICGDTEPKKGPLYLEGWYSCMSSKCPFVYCVECWREVGARCLACDPQLAQLSDADSLTDEDPPRLKGVAAEMHRIREATILALKSGNVTTIDFEQNEFVCVSYGCHGLQKSLNIR